jgi:sodium/bile acid cotransporter 7
MKPREVVAVCFCGPAKSTGLGIPLLYSMWAAVDLTHKAKASIPVLLYTTEQVVVAHFLVHWLRRWIERKEALKESSSDSTESGIFVEEV